MKVAVVAGVPRSLINFRGPLLKALIDAGHEVIAGSSGRPIDVLTKLERMGVTYREISLQRTGMNPLEDIKTTLELRRFFAVSRPDIVLLYTIKPVIYGSFAAGMVNIPKVFSMITGLGYTFGEGSRKQRLLGNFAQRMYRHALRRNEAIFFQNPDDQHLFLEKRLVSGREKTVLINGSGVDLKHYAKVPVVTDPVSFLLIARLLKDKGIREYVQAARIVKRKFPNVTFRLVGPFDSNPSSISEETVRQWQGEGVVEYLGPTKDVRPFISESSVYVLPSYREGTPRTVLEAMAMGRPVITTDAPGCRETVVDGKNGYLVPIKDPEALATAMQRFIDNRNLITNMGEEAWKIAVEKYDVHKVNATILDAMGLL